MCPLDTAVFGSYLGVFAELSAGGAQLPLAVLHLLLRPQLVGGDLGAVRGHGLGEIADLKSCNLLIERL